MPAGRTEANSLAAVESSIAPVPTDDEAAAIAAAIEVLWPRASSSNDGSARRGSVWRFSGRWWSQPIPLRRARPWM
jgi:hypothetical protein